ncbi:MAG TPA: nitroreductase family protein [Nitrospirae bacterium]|nr:nitroreductase family protein [Nitrospirota bacterium]
MNSVLDTIKKRRSVRSYLSKPVPRDILNTIIEAGNQAPSAMNSQPWRFVVVEDGSLKQKLLQAALPNAKQVLEHVKEIDPSRYELIIKRYDEMKDPIYYSAPAIVFIIGSGRYADNSCPLACENIMLAALSLGIGSCWVGFGSMVTEDAGIRAELVLKDDDKIYGPILLGYPDVYPEAPEKKPPEVKWI